MSTQIISFDITPVLIQAGYGIPNHLSSLGSEYTDLYTGLKYVNKNGILGWVRMLDITGGTITGPTIFTNGLTANTISVNDYIDFNTGSTIPLNISGRVYYDNESQALAYFPNISQNVKVEMGQQLYIRGFNNTGSIIPKGTVLSIQSATNDLPNFTPAVIIHRGFSQVIGLAASDIPINGNGLALSQGILSGITINNFNVGDILYASPFSAGTYVANTITFPFSARTNQIGFVIATGTTTGKIYVSINNEDENLTLTDIERNILEGNVISTGAYEFTGLTKASNTTFNVAPLKGWIVRNTYEFATLPNVINLVYSGQTGLTTPYLNSANSTYVMINSAATINLLATSPTPQERRENIYLGKIIHPDKTIIQNVNNTTDYDVSPMSAIRDLFTPIKLINDGVVISPNGANLSFNQSYGKLWGNGIGWATNQLNPNMVIISANTPTTFQYRTSTGGTFSSTTFVDNLHYDVNGVRTLIPGNLGSQMTRATNHRIYLFATGLVRVQYGQNYYESLTESVAAIQTEIFTEFVNNKENGILIGILSVTRACTALNDTTNAKISYVSKFGELFGGTGGLSTTNLQQAYDNSTNPEIVINATLDGLTIKNGTGNADNITRLLEGYNAAGNTTSFIRADGDISGTTIQTNGAYLNNNGITATTVSATTIKTPSITANATGLSANTITATSITSNSTYGTVNVNAGNNQSMIVVSGSNTIGGTGYTDFIKVTNTAAGATNINKTIRVNNTGSIEFINSVYTTTTFTIADNGIITISSPASVTSNSATNNALNIGTKGQIFDDGNFHIHSSTGAVWINALDGSAIRLGTQTNSGNSTVIVDTTTVGHSFFTKVQSGFNVAFGTEITMDNLKVRINGTGGSGGLVQAGSVSGSFAAYTTLIGNVAGAALQGDTNSGGITFTTTYQNISSVQKTLSSGGDTTTLHLIDTTNSRIYRITAIHCQGTTGGYISIERMS